MTPITKTITAIVFIGLFATSLACEAKTNITDKYHLVYLVSVPKLEVGKKVYVEPLFLTNGNTLVPFYDYCRWYTKNALINFNRKHPVPKYRELRVSTSKKFLDNYCNGVPVKVFGQLYTLNNYGEEIIVKSVQFTDLNTELRILKQSYSLPFLADRGIGRITKVVNKTKLTLDKYKHPTDLDRHFLMSTDPYILKKIVPMQMVDQKTVNYYLERANKFAKKNKGLLKPTLEWEVLKKPRKLGYDGSKVYLSIPLFGDINADGKRDMIIGVRLFQDTEKLTWDAVGIFYGNNNSNYFSTIGRVKKVLTQQRNNYSVGTPLVNIKIKNCLYNIFYTGLRAYWMFSIGKTNCSKYTMKKYYLSTLY